MNHITLVYPYFNNGSMLDIQLGEWSKYANKECWKAIIVDDCSKTDPAIDHLKYVNVGFPIELYRINTDIAWNQHGARNLAMTHTEPDDWCLMTDMDHLLPRENADAIVNNLHLSNKFLYRPARKLILCDEPHKIHANTFLLQSKLFWSIGGYDERFSGLYGTDGHFRRRLLKAAKGVVMMDISIIMYTPDVIGDACTTEYGRKDSSFHAIKDPIYRKMYRRPQKPIKPLNFKWERLL